MIGDEDAFSERKYYSTTIRWASTKGRVYYINNKDLHNIIQNKSISYELFGKEALSKDVEILKKLNIKDEFLNKSKKISERLKVKEIMINFYSEFFKQVSILSLLVIDIKDTFNCFNEKWWQYKFEQKCQ